MRILLLTENWPPRQGGIENYLTAIASHLPAGTVTVVAPPGANSLAQNKAPVLPRRFFWPIIKPSWLPLFMWLWRRQKKQPATILLCGKALFEGLIGYYLKKYWQVPYIVFTYAMEIETWQNSPRLRRKLIRVLQSADRIVYINDQTKRHLQKLGVQEQQLVKIWPGVAPLFFSQPSAASVATTLAKHQVHQPYIICVARSVPRKGIDLLIESFAALDQTRFSDISLVIVGQGPELPRLKDLARKNYVGPRVKFLTTVPTNDLPALYAGALFFAMTPRELPGDSEGFGIVYLEAGAQGKAAIGTRTGGVPEAIIDQHTGLLVEPDSHAITRALTTLLTNTALREKMGAAAQKRVGQEFDWRKRIMLVQGMIDAVTSSQTGRSQ